MKKKKNTPYSELPPWVTGNTNADPMTSGYGGSGVSLLGCLIPAALIVMPIIILLVSIVVETVKVNLDQDVSTTAPTTITEEEKTSGPPAEKEISYKKTVIFDNMTIDVPSAATETPAEEGVCFETPDQSLRVLIVRIPDPNDAYPENIIDYCNQRNIDLQYNMDSDGNVLFYAESTETDENGNNIYVDEDFRSFNNDSYRLRVESRTDDNAICSHIFNSFSEK